jgi:hypothetical protein
MSSISLSSLSENSTRNIKAIKEMETFKHEFQIRCSHYELEQANGDYRITCTICSKIWFFSEERGYSIKKKIYAAEREET